MTRSSLFFRVGLFDSSLIKQPGRKNVRDGTSRRGRAYTRRAPQERRGTRRIPRNAP